MGYGNDIFETRPIERYGNDMLWGKEWIDFRRGEDVDTRSLCASTRHIRTSSICSLIARLEP